VNEYVGRTRQAAEEVSAVVEQSKQQVAALVDHSREQVNDLRGSHPPGRQEVAPLSIRASSRWLSSSEKKQRSR